MTDRDITLIQNQCNCSEEIARKAYAKNGGDLVNAIMSITMDENTMEKSVNESDINTFENPVIVLNGKNPVGDLETYLEKLYRSPTVVTEGTSSAPSSPTVPNDRKVLGIKMGKRILVIVGDNDGRDSFDGTHAIALDIEKERDLKVIQSQCACTREQAEKAYIEKNYSVIDAIMTLSMNDES